MTPDTASLAPVVPPAKLAAWRRAASGRTPEPVALVTGRFHMLQPDNLHVLRRAAANGRRVCVAIDDVGASTGEAAHHAARAELAERIEFMSFLRHVSVVTWTDPAAPDAFSGLRPFVRVHGVGSPAAPFDDAPAEPIPRIPGAGTADVEAAIRAGRTPVAVPPDIYPPPAADTPGRTGPGHRLVTVNGCFDILHVGHLRFLAQARAHGDRLVVLVNSDASVRRYKGNTRPVFPLAFRAAALLALRVVDAVVPFDADEPIDALRALQPDVHVKGGTFVDERVRHERELLASWGGTLAMSPMEGAFSTSRVIERILAAS